MSLPDGSTLREGVHSETIATRLLEELAREITTAGGIAPAIVESCASRIFLPNAQAIEPQVRSIYEGFGLSSRQIEIVARATPKRDYYCQSARGHRLFELGLGEVALAFTAPITGDAASEPPPPHY